MKHMAIIPARLSSTRLPEKPLQKILDKTLIEFVAEEVLKTGVFNEVFVATDSKKIAELFKNSEITALMTDEAHQSGTDRIFEAAQSIKDDFDTVINIQGDEPFVYQKDLKTLIKVLEEGSQMASLYSSITKDDLDDPNKVKVLLDDKSEAIYFSRLPAPFTREKVSVSGEELNFRYIGKHIGVYAYHKNFLKEFCEHSVGYHEQFEKLEQLRALQMGAKIKMIYTEHAYQGVDTKEDLEKVNKIMKERSL
jgi:3-deoxy-manno-octulosonate cytidylyltransferase (CMP-KDO synthetase)